MDTVSDPTVDVVCGGVSPWCYTTDLDLRWEYCDIPKCGKYYTVMYYIININNQQRKNFIREFSVRANIAVSLPDYAAAVYVVFLTTVDIKSLLK